VLDGIDSDLHKVAGNHQDLLEARGSIDQGKIQAEHTSIPQSSTASKDVKVEHVKSPVASHLQTQRSLRSWPTMSRTLLEPQKSINISSIASN
jgi:hypothetical protein